MEKRMEECTQEIMKEPSVRGVVCTDTNGALYCAKGTMDSAHSSAIVSQLANLGAILEPNSQPVAIALSCSSIPSTLPLSSMSSQQLQQQTPKSGSSKVLIKSNGLITVAVHK